ncbi:unnamed protein product, partial [Meganyctiphanes norvegica]
GRVNNITFSKENEYAVTFEQFLNYITTKMDRHWIPMHHFCAPCNNHYDFYLDLATFKDDLRYIYKQVGIEEPHEDNGSTNSTRNNSTKKAGPKLSVSEYFKDIPKQLLEKVYKIYRLDFKLFGYEIP